jgi:thioesterase domain-containing protein
MTPELRERLRQRKSEIVEFLQQVGALAAQERNIIPLQPRGKCAPIFAIGGHRGDAFAFRALARHLDQDQPLFGLQFPGSDAKSDPLTTIPELGTFFADRVQAFHPDRPVIVAGYCSGGSVAFELAQQLRSRGVEVLFLALLAAPYPNWFEAMHNPYRRALHKVKGVVRHARALYALPHEHRVDYLARVLSRPRLPHKSDADPLLLAQDRIASATIKAVCEYSPAPYPGRVHLLLPSNCPPSTMSDWRGVAQDSDEFFGPAGGHADMMLSEPFVQHTADMLRVCCERAVYR